MSKWQYKGLPVENIEDLNKIDPRIPTELVGFVYLVEWYQDYPEKNEWQVYHFYVGKKQFYSHTKAKIGVREKAATKTRKTYKRTTKESNWKSYCTSSKPIQALVEQHGEQLFKWTILEPCCTLKMLSYQEIRYQIKFDCLESINCFNDNIAGKYYKPIGKC